MKLARKHGQAAALVTFAKKQHAQRAAKMDQQLFGGFKVGTLAVNCGHNLLQITVTVPPPPKLNPASVSQSTPAPSAHATTPHQQLDVHQQAQKILETGRLFVRNLPYTVGEKELRVTLEEYGAITDVKVGISIKSLTA